MPARRCAFCWAVEKSKALQLRTNHPSTLRRAQGQGERGFNDESAKEPFVLSLSKDLHFEPTTLRRAQGERNFIMSPPKNRSS